MKSLVSAVVAAAALTASFGALAQQGPVTRAQVREELVQLEQAGYQPGVSSPYYPNDIQAAEARVSANNTGYGPQAAPTVSGGAPAVTAPADSQHQSVYFGGH